MNHQIPVNPPPPVHRHLPPHPPHTQPPRSLQLAVVQVDVSGVQVTCCDSDHPPDLGHVQVLFQGVVTHYICQVVGADAMLT